MGLPCAGEWREGLVYHGEIHQVTLLGYGERFCYIVETYINCRALEGRGHRRHHVVGWDVASPQSHFDG